MPRKSKSKEADGVPQEAQRDGQQEGRQVAQQEAQQDTQARQKGANPEHRLVVVGSSAGGIHALSVLVSTLPLDFPAPIVIAQHLDPSRPSNLTSILEHRTSLPVVTVSTSTLMQAGTIYVVPSNRHVSISGGHVEVRDDLADRPRPSVDLLLTSAAQSYGDCLIAVVLTGSGTDGAAGAIEVKKAGGYVVIQNPGTALYPSMPLALPPTAVDKVADLEDIGPALVELLRSTELPELVEQPPDVVEHILSLVKKQASIDFRQYKPSTILRRISRRMVVTRTATLNDYTEYLEAHPEEVIELSKAFLIKVTEFFRDPEAFEFLKTSVLPDMIEEGRARGNVLRLWSAGCATGEEPYSLALLLADLLDLELPDWNIKIFATDVDEDAINFARRGLYPENLLTNLPDDYRKRFFSRLGDGYQVTKALRQLVIFGQQDLSRGVPFPRVDLVSCRNLLIYFKPELQQHVLDMFTFSLQQTGGYLFLGHAETVRPSQSYYQQVNKHWKVYRCIRSKLPVIPKPVAHSPGTGGPPAPTERSTGLAQRSPGPAEHSGHDPEVLNLRRFNELVLRQLPMGVVVIDRSYRIISINTAARRLLAIRESGIEHDFLHSVRGLPYAKVRAAIDTAFRDRSAVLVQELELDQSVGGSGHYVTLTVMPVDTEHNAPEMEVICVQDVTETVETRRNLEAVQTEQKELLSEIQATNRRLGDMNKDLQDANEELQAANEELMLAQEELQSTNEELEATNEELQASNEELETSNEELQATNEELETTNEELNARTNEMQELGRVLATERKRLLEILELAPFYVLILRGADLKIEAFNPSYERLFRGREVIGMPLRDVLETARPEMRPLVEAAYAAYEKDAPQVSINMVVPGSGGNGSASTRLLTYGAAPLHDASGKVDGVAVYGDEVPSAVQEAFLDGERG
ncbi:MAG TPA: CheR family methyltransferase [Chloroflexia bacterium]|jgi:two-component system CheB/CheR fusion protein